MKERMEKFVELFNSLEIGTIKHSAKGAVLAKMTFDQLSNQEGFTSLFHPEKDKDLFNMKKQDICRFQAGSLLL